jgi:hypothetical protein
VPSTVFIKAPAAGARPRLCLIVQRDLSTCLLIVPLSACSCRSHSADRLRLICRRGYLAGRRKILRDLFRSGVDQAAAGILKLAGTRGFDCCAQCSRGIPNLLLECLVLVERLV